MNMNIHKAYAAVLGLCLVALPAIAQQDNGAPPPPPAKGRHFGGPGGPDRFADHFAQQLGLSPEQTAQVKSIQQQTRKQEFELRKQEQDQIRALLTDEQKAKLDQMHAKMKERFHGHRPGPGAPPPPPAQQ